MVATVLHRSIVVSDQDFARLQFFFLLSYAVMYAVGGRIVDWLGARLGYTLFVVWWSLATILHGFVSSVTGFAVGRLLLGFGEGGGFPAAAKAVSEWFPARDRSFAFGIFNAGASVGAVIAPPMLASIITLLNWRWAFFVTGSLGILWAAGWYRLYEQPQRHPRITDTERAYLAEHMAAFGSTRPLRWKDLFRIRQTWGLLSAAFFSHGAWYFFLFWLPKYLADARGLDIQHIGYFAWIPFVFMGLGSVAGGWFSGLLMRHGFSLDASRKISLAVGAAIMPVSLLVASAPLSLAIALVSAAMFGHMFFATLLQTLSADMFPSEVVGSVAGLLGAVGSFGGISFNLVIAASLAHYGSYAPVFAIAGVMHPLAFVLLLVVVRRVDRIASFRLERVT
jgi:ACS family hexuronate transporter-like MFS transporter